MPDYGTIIDAAARSDSVNQSGLVLDMEDRTAELEPNSFIFEHLSRQIGPAIEATRMKHEYRERRPIPNATTIAVGSAANASTIQVVDYSYIKTDCYLYLPASNDLLLVQTAPTSQSVSIVDGTTGTGNTQSATEAGDVVLILGESHAEGESIPAAYTNISVNDYDYLMQKDRVVQVTDIENAIKHYDSRESRALDRKIAMIEYKRDQNLLYYVGQRGRETGSASVRRHCCGGLIEKLTENNLDLAGAAGGFTLATLNTIMGDVVFYGASGSKIGLFGNQAWRSISSWPENYLRVSPMNKVWGVNINRILTGFGPIDVAYDSVLDATRGLDDRAFIIDPAQTRSLYLSGNRVRMFINIADRTDIHNIKDAISGTFAIQVKLRETAAQLSGISA